MTISIYNTIIFFIIFSSFSNFLFFIKLYMIKKTSKKSATYIIIPGICNTLINMPSNKTMYSIKNKSVWGLILHIFYTPNLFFINMIIHNSTIALCLISVLIVFDVFLIPTLSNLFDISLT